MKHWLIASLLLSSVTLGATPENLARKATATATSEYNDQYLAKFAIDGKIPEAESHADLSEAWCVQGNTHRNGAEFTMTWPTPVTVGEIVYYGRTAWMLSECWKDYQVFLDGTGAPVVTGQLEETSAPQRIKLPTPTQAQRVTIKFLSSYGGLNPGASKIMVFAAPTAPGSLPGETRPLVAVDFKSLRLGFDKLLVVQHRLQNPTHVYTYHQEDLSPGGGLWLCDFANAERKQTRIVDSSKGLILDANLHYNGKTILFSWKRTMKDKFQLFTVDIDGNNLKQLTEHDSNNFNASWLPDGGIVFLSDRKPAFAYCWNTTTPILHRCEADGSKPQRISANYLNDFTPSVFSDGRIIYGRWEYVDRPAIPTQSLWAINPDGTRLSGIFGNRVLSPATFMDGREIPGSKGKILCVLTSHNGPCRGAIGIVDPKLGSNAQEAILNLTPEIDIGKVNQGDGNHIRGPYLNPFPLDDKYYLVSKAGIIELRDYKGNMKVPLIIPADMGLGFYNPQPIIKRHREKLITSTLQNRQDEKWATIFMQNVYNGLDPALVPQGTIKKLAIVQEMEKPIGIDPGLRAFGFQFPVVSAGATYAPKKVWGYATVEADGSAYFKVPAQEPIYFLPLDSEGRAVQRMRTFTHLMPGEFQGCIGCHADRNSVVLESKSVRSSAMKRKPEDLIVPPWGLAGFSYSSIVQLVLDKHCIRCHGRDNPAGGLELTGDKTDFFNISYDSLVRRGTPSEDFSIGGTGGAFRYSKYTSWIPTYNGQEANILEITPGRWGAKASLLADIIRDGHKDKEGKNRIDLSDVEKRSIYAWLDLNCPYYSSSDSTYRTNRGCRQILPAELPAVFKEISQRLCISCHKQQENIFSYRKCYAVRLDNPQWNLFLRAPLAKSAGGTEACGKIIFPDTNDSDYQAILKTFEPITAMLKAKPRDDMPGTNPDLPVCRNLAQPR